MFFSSQVLGWKNDTLVCILTLHNRPYLCIYCDLFALGPNVQHQCVNWRSASAMNGISFECICEEMIFQFSANSHNHKWLFSVIEVWSQNDFEVQLEMLDLQLAWRDVSFDFLRWNFWKLKLLAAFKNKNNWHQDDGRHNLGKNRISTNWVFPDSDLWKF